MLFQRFEVSDLSHYSYAVGCQAEREIAIVDPERDVDRYLQYAHENGVRITHVLETHIHADYASGAPALAARTGAVCGVSRHDEGELYTVRFPHLDIEEGDTIQLGRVRLVARHTPGHTPEHLSYLVYDGARSEDTPIIMLSGDFLFVGSLGRPDLLGEDAKRELASRLFRSVRALADLPDGLEVHPAHGAGSMCGAGMSGRASSTLGYERMANPYLDPALDEDAFVARILGSVPPFPPYYRRMKTLNSAGAPDLATRPPVAAMTPAEVERARSTHVLIDLRDQAGFDGGHIPGSFGIGIAGNFTTWAAWVVPYEQPIILVADHEADARRAQTSLAHVGLDDVVGTLAGGIEAWRADGRPLGQIKLLTPEHLEQARASNPDLRVLDVRSDAEWASGHIPDATHIMGGLLPESLDALPDRSQPIAVVCGGGYRSVVAASVLARAGFTNVADVLGGMAAWRRAGLPIQKDPIEVLQ